MVKDQELGSSMNDILHINLERHLKLCLFSYIGETLYYLLIEGLFVAISAAIYRQL